MKRKILSCLMAVLLALTLLVPAAQAQAAETPLLRFVTTSDLHLDDSSYGAGNVEQMNAFFRLIGQSSYDALILGGDYSDHGERKYYAQVKQALTACSNIPTVLWAIGNHEYGYIPIAAMRERDQATTRKWFVEETGMPAIYYHTTVKGYHFIVLGAEDCTWGNLSSAQISWFKTEIAKAAADSPGRPVFVVSHFDIDENGMERDFAGTLASWPNVVFLWGHEHDYAAYNDTIGKVVNSTRFGFTTAEMGAMNYYDYPDVAQGLEVDVYPDRIEYTILRAGGGAVADAHTSVPLTGLPPLSVWSGSGTAADPWRISTPAELAYFSALVNGGRDMEGQHVLLTADLTLTAANFTLPAGGNGRPFAGSFDGGGHTITLADGSAELSSVLASYQGLSDLYLSAGGARTWLWDEALSAADTRLLAACYDANGKMTALAGSADGRLRFSLACEPGGRQALYRLDGSFAPSD